MFFQKIAHPSTSITNQSASQYKKKEKYQKKSWLHIKDSNLKLVWPTLLVLHLLVCASKENSSYSILLQSTPAS